MEYYKPSYKEVATGVALSFFIAGVLFILAPTFGTIPVADGFGWDGDAFNKIILELVNDSYTNSEPYRTIRTLAFPLLYVVYFFKIPGDILFYQKLFNILLISSSFFLVYLAMLINRVKYKNIAVSLTCFMASWCILVMPLYYPILSDHIVIFISALALFFWSIGSFLGLSVLILLGVWIMPSSFLIPLALLSFPGKNTGVALAIINEKKIKYIAFIVTCFIALLLYLTVGNGLFDGIEKHGVNVARNITKDLTGDRKLLPLSIVIALIMTYLWFTLAIKLIANKTVFKEISHFYLLAGLTLALVSFIIMRLIIDFSSGFSGPPLLANLIKQTFAAPGKTWLAHFIYFGPCVIIAYCNLFTKNIQSVPTAVIVCMAGFFPMLSFGSESRQWIVIFPVIIFAFAFFNLKFYSSLVVILYSLILLKDALVLKNATIEALNSNIGYQDSLWQIYFGKFGPWMAMSVYDKGLFYCCTFIILYLLALKVDNKSSVPVVNTR